MADDHEHDRARIIDRANRMLKQSRTLRRLADELRDESGVIRRSAKALPRKKGSKHKKKT